MRTIFSNRELIHDFSAEKNYRQTGTGEVLECPGKGTVTIELEGPNGTIPWKHNNVLWCPNLGHNLLGTIPLARSGIEVALKPLDKPSEFRKRRLLLWVCGHYPRSVRSSWQANSNG